MTIMNFREVFDVFSRRQAPLPAAPVPPNFRQRLFMRCTDVFGVAEYERPHKHFWDEIHERLRYIIGRPQLTPNQRVDRIMDDIAGFLTASSHENYLDFIECIFKTNAYRQFWRQENFLVEEINDLFSVDNLPFALTPFARETRIENVSGHPHETTIIVAYPKIIRRDNQATHACAIEPALTLLRDRQFTSANQSFLEALADHRKGDSAGCLTHCCSALESTMKIVCDRNGWPYLQNDTAAPLLRVIMQHSGMEAYFEQPLIVIATLRNRLSSSHGSGVQPRQVPDHLAEYAINSTAAAILLVIAQCA
jgi:hypothetical protein